MNIKYTKIFKKLIAGVLIITLTINMPIQSKIKDKTVKAEIISKQTEWNIKCINAEKSYEESKNLKKIKVAILDSGLDFDPDIQAVEKKDFLGDEELHPLYQDMTGHGTSVASLICAKENEDRVTGIAANVDLYVARILDKKNDAPVDRVINAIHWAMSKQVNIIHMSFGTKKYSADLEKAINDAYKAGILIIAAAGNEGKAHEDESNIEYPAAFKNVISVGSTNNMNDLTEFSSTGEELDVVAPGNQVLTAGAFGGVCVESGSSISAAQVTGVAAVLWGKHPEKSNEFIKGLLVGNANKEAITSDDCGNGLIDYEESDKNYSDMNRLYDKYKSDGISEEKAVEKAENKMPENAKKVTTSEVDYVNASWHKAQHQAAASLEGISEDIINIIKTGAYKPDKVGTLNKKDKHRGWRGMVDNPYFHGRKNYLVNTHYLLCLAKNYINGHPKLPTNKQLRKNQKKIVVKDYEKLVERLKTKGMLNSFFTECQVNTGTNKKEIIKNEGYALLGAAIHNITDAFSHSVYKRTSKKYGKEWLHIVHKGKSTGLLWKDYANDKYANYITSQDRKFFAYMSDNFSKADIEDELGIMYELAQKAAQCVLLDALNGKVWYKLFKHKINNKSKGKFRLEKLNINWERLTGEKFDFGLLNPPSKQKNY